MMYNGNVKHPCHCLGPSLADSIEQYQMLSLTIFTSKLLLSVFHYPFFFHFSKPYITPKYGAKIMAKMRNNQIGNLKSIAMKLETPK